MELAGDEKRIQALFSELRFEDQSMAPSFNRLWKSARTMQPQPVAFVQPLVVLGALAAIAVFFALGLRSPEPTIPVIAHVYAPLALPSIESRLEVPKKPGPRSHHTVHRRSRMNESEHTVIQQAELLASWQSPTGGLMESATGPFLNSLPEFTESVKELELYLSINEVKELK